MGNIFEEKAMTDRRVDYEGEAAASFALMDLADRRARGEAPPIGEIMKQLKGQQAQLRANGGGPVRRNMAAQTMVASRRRMARLG
jgi:hypothetical protein